MFRYPSFRSCGTPGCRCNMRTFITIPKCDCYECRLPSRFTRHEDFCVLPEVRRPDFLAVQHMTLDCKYCKECPPSQTSTLLGRGLNNDERCGSHYAIPNRQLMKKDYIIRRAPYNLHTYGINFNEKQPRIYSAPAASQKLMSTLECPRAIESDVMEKSAVRLSKPKIRQKRRFQCLYCEKSFGKSSHLRDHHRTHSGERPFGCRYCGKAFSQFSNLRTHLRIHTGEKPFKCQICEKSFTQRVTLRSHMRTHTNKVLIKTE